MSRPLRRLTPKQYDEMRTELILHLQGAIHDIIDGHWLCAWGTINMVSAVMKRVLIADGKIGHPLPKKQAKGRKCNKTKDL